MKSDYRQYLLDAVRKTPGYYAVLDPVCQVEDQRHHGGVFSHSGLADAPEEAILENDEG